MYTVLIGLAAFLGGGVTGFMIGAYMLAPRW